MHNDRRAAVAIFAVQLYAKIGQAFEQIGNRALMHPLSALQAKTAMAERGHARQKANASAAVGDIEVGICRRNFAARTNDSECFAVCGCIAP